MEEGRGKNRLQVTSYRRQERWKIEEGRAKNRKHVKTIFDIRFHDFLAISNIEPRTLNLERPTGHRVKRNGSCES